MQRQPDTVPPLDTLRVDLSSATNPINPGEQSEERPKNVDDARQLSSTASLKQESSSIADAIPGLRAQVSALRLPRVKSTESLHRHIRHSLRVPQSKLAENRTLEKWLSVPSYLQREDIAGNPLFIPTLEEGCVRAVGDPPTTVTADIAIPPSSVSPPVSPREESLLASSVLAEAAAESNVAALRTPVKPSGSPLGQSARGRVGLQSPPSVTSPMETDETHVFDVYKPIVLTTHVSSGPLEFRGGMLSSRSGFILDALPFHFLRESVLRPGDSRFRGTMQFNRSHYFGDAQAKEAFKEDEERMEAEENDAEDPNLKYTMIMREYAGATTTLVVRVYFDPSRPNGSSYWRMMKYNPKVFEEQRAQLLNDICENRIAPLLRSILELERKRVLLISTAAAFVASPLSMESTSGGDDDQAFASTAREARKTTASPDGSQASIGGGLPRVASMRAVVSKQGHRSKFQQQQALQRQHAEAIREKLRNIDEALNAIGAESDTSTSTVPDIQARSPSPATPDRKTKQASSTVLASGLLAMLYQPSYSVDEGGRMPLHAEEKLVHTKPHLFHWCMNRNLLELTNSTMMVRSLLEYNRYFRNIILMVRRLQMSVRLLQRFIRVVFRKKHAARDRMLTRWDILEQEKLNRLENDATEDDGKDPLNDIVRHILRDNTLTPREHKLTVIREEWDLRKHFFRESCHVDRHTGALVAEASFSWSIPEEVYMDRSHRRLMDRLTQGKDSLFFSNDVLAYVNAKPGSKLYGESLARASVVEKPNSRGSVVGTRKTDSRGGRGDGGSQRIPSRCGSKDAQRSSSRGQPHGGSSREGARVSTGHVPREPSVRRERNDAPAASVTPSGRRTTSRSGRRSSSSPSRQSTPHASTPAPRVVPHRTADFLAQQRLQRNNSRPFWKRERSVGDVGERGAHNTKK